MSQIILNIDDKKLAEMIKALKLEQPKYEVLAPLKLLELLINTDLKGGGYVGYLSRLTDEGGNDLIGDVLEENECEGIVIEHMESFMIHDKIKGMTAIDIALAIYRDLVDKHPDEDQYVKVKKMSRLEMEQYLTDMYEKQEEEECATSVETVIEIVSRAMKLVHPRDEQKLHEIAKKYVSISKPLGEAIEEMSIDNREKLIAELKQLWYRKEK